MWLVVVNLDPPGWFGQFEEFGQFALDPGLRPAFGQAPVQRFYRIARSLFDQPSTIAALGHRDLHLAARALPKRFGQKFCFGQFAVDQNRARRRDFLIELGEEALQHLLIAQPFGMGGEEGAVAPVLAAADEERLHANLAVAGWPAQRYRLCPCLSALIA